MYSNRVWSRPAFLPQLSPECCLLTSPGDATGDRPRSTEMLPTLTMSASLDATEPREDGRDVVLLLRKLRRPPPSRTEGDFGAVREEKPLGGLAVLMTGGAAASSSRSAPASLSRRSVEESFEKAP
ncbi:hypothetical protein M406DRAFT_355504, partial [Cryphonectria parasitica EP155]